MYSCCTPSLAWCCCLTCVELTSAGERSPPLAGALLGCCCRANIDTVCSQAIRSGCPARMLGRSLILAPQQRQAVKRGCLSASTMRLQRRCVPGRQAKAHCKLAQPWTFGRSGCALHDQHASCCNLCQASCLHLLAPAGMEGQVLACAPACRSSARYADYELGAFDSHKVSWRWCRL